MGRGDGPWVARFPSLVWLRVGDRRPSAAQVVGSDHEPSHCRCGMWLHARRMLYIDAEHELLKSSPATEALRIESEPPGADARTSHGQSCRTPCELTVQDERRARR